MPISALPARINLALSIFLMAAFLATLFALPAVVGLWPLIAVTVFLVPLNTPLWSLIHEAIHKNFHPDKRVNEISGRALSVLFGASFGILRFGHLMHHQYNRDWESEYYTGSKAKAWAHHYFQMLGGLYLTEVALSFLVAALPAGLTRKIARAAFPDERHYQAVLNSVLKPDNVRKIRTDCLWILLVYACAIAISWVAALGLLGRAVIISIMDNSYHYATPRDGSIAAKELETPKAYSRFILSFNYHLTHHNNVSLPWTELEAAHQADATPYAQKIGPALLAQFKGPIPLDKST